MSCVCAIGGGKTKTNATSGHHVMFVTIGGIKTKTNNINLNRKHWMWNKSGRCLTSVKVNSSPSSTFGMVVFPCETTR